MSAETPPPAAASPAQAFFDDVDDAYRRAAAATGVTHRTYRLGALSFRLHFAGSQIVDSIAPALEHLEIADEGQPGLEVFLWDVASTGVPLPRCAWDWSDNPARGDVFGLSDESFLVAYSQFARLLTVLDHRRGRALLATADVRESGRYIGATPLLDVLHPWLERRGLQMVHGAAVGVESGGVLLAGKGGSGKSTTALACLSSRLGFAGDDYCAIGTIGEPRAFALYNSARLETDNLRRLPDLAPLFADCAAAAADGDKATVFLQRHFPEKLIREFPLRAVLLPRITGEPRSRLRPISRMEAFRELAVTTISQRAGAGRGAFEGLARVVKQLPCHALELGTDLRQLVELLEDFVVDAR